MDYILNSFSPNMIAAFPAEVEFREISLDEARFLIRSGGEINSAVGHADTANIFSKMIGVTVPMKRITVALEPGDVAIIGQYRGPRLPEGATELPEGATIQWLLMAVRAAEPLSH